MRRLIAPFLLLAFAITACGDDTPEGANEDVEAFTLRERLVRIDDAVVVWEDATTIEDAHAAAETAANLVTGSGGPGYGDRDGDGEVGGETDFGVLMGVDGEPVGLADAVSDNSCVVDDVLGGAWDDPAARWAQLDEVVAGWSDDSTSMTDLASHPMRIVGWAMLALDTDDLDAAVEYAGHAQLHVDVSLEALDCGDAGS
jgi:predicted small secreted protein